MPFFSPLPLSLSSQQRRRPRALLPSLVTLLLALSGCSLWKPAPPPPPPAPLVNPQVLLLGEVHDNAAGHRARFEELKRRVLAGWRPAIAMEQFDEGSQALLTRAQRDCADPACIVRVMEGPRWDWDLYKPVLDLALTYDLPLLAANLSRADASRVVRDGFGTTFDAATIAAYKLHQLPADIVAAQQREIVASHCNMLPEMMVGGMVNAQIARDVMMAKVVRAEASRGVVLLAGNGHVRKDIGVPRWLNATTPVLSVSTVAYVEKGDQVSAGEYDTSTVLAPHVRPDPCAKFKAR
jgi:uncharacterized iron-regulated protein